MTIRDYLRSRRRLWLYGIAIFAALMFAGLWHGTALGPDQVPEWRRVLALVGALGVMILLGVQFYLIRCPRCQRFMGPELRVGFIRPINYCPYCGVHLDDELK